MNNIFLINLLFTIGLGPSNSPHALPRSQPSRAGDIQCTEVSAQSHGRSAATQCRGEGTGEGDGRTATRTDKYATFRGANSNALAVDLPLFS